jgi:hypothetical protein
MRYHFKAMPLFLGTYNVGVLEGAFLALNATGEVRVYQSGLADASYEFTWA